MAGTAYELYEAFESMKDLGKLYADLGMAHHVPGDVVRCKKPNSRELVIFHYVSAQNLPPHANS